MQHFSDEAIQEVYKMSDAVRDIRELLIDLNNDQIINEERTVIQVPGTDNTVLYMPCINIHNKYSILKTISIFPDNINIPVSQGITLLTELENGEHIATLESSYLTRLRTGAMSALATDHLAAEKAASLAIIGTGGMAYEQALGVLAVREIKNIYLYNRTSVKAELFKASLEQSTQAAITICQTSSEAVKHADIINCATRSNEPVFHHEDIKSEVHINGVGSYLPSMREIDIQTIQAADTIVMDDKEGAMQEAGEFIEAEKQGLFDFGQILLLKDIAISQSNKKGITIFKSVGAAYYDLAVTVGAYQKLKS
ncbi:ornithine cyclodeaminase family protein [Macrococcus brunensis]|uniref:ornithine cyclodeaminase family protein n=1 Tax=Macrococcus brunensis TaxID=198483 RepID=UPI001EF0CA0C|nr:ornithine cyclodeaminase family protein [Macrococcus brunensis]ULG73772.1 ornithine cyclodeaminase family protein [Macrococcus brunensis]